MQVMSATQSTLGAPAAKLRWTRSGAWRPPSRAVVVTKRRRLTPARPAVFINRATRLRLIDGPLDKFGMDARAAIGPVRGRVNGADALDQRGVVCRARRRRPFRPRIVAAGGDVQHTAHGGDWINGPVCASRIGTPRRNRLRLPSEPGRGF